MPKALPGFFLCIFSSLYLPEETCFQQAGSFVVEGTSQAILGSSDERKVSEKIPALLYVGKGPVLYSGPSPIQITTQHWMLMFPILTLACLNFELVGNGIED